MMPFIGRAAEIGAIQEHLLHVSTGQPRLVLVEGLVGMGKSRFLSEVQRIAQEQGFQVASGRCTATLTEPLAAFAPLLPRFDYERVLEEQDLAQLHDLMRPVVRDPLSVNLETPPDNLELRRVVARATILLALREPLVLLMDDLHQADAGPLDLFSYLAFALAEERAVPLLLIGAHRPMPRGSRFGALRSLLVREVFTREMTLAGFTEDETRAMLVNAGLARPTRQLVRLIQDTSHGVPLFTETVIRYLTETGALFESTALAQLRMPESMTEAIGRQLQFIPPEAVLTLSIAACFGERFSVQPLSMIVNGEVEEALTLGETHGILVREGDEAQFTHALIRDALYARLSAPEREGMHAFIAQMLEQRDSDDLILEIAHHLLLAGPSRDQSVVFDYARRAGDQAFARYAWRDAIRFYEAAIDIAAALDTVSPQERADILLKAGQAHFRNQDAGLAMERLEQAEVLYHNVSRRGHCLRWITQLRFMHVSVPVGTLPDIAPLLEVLEQLGDSEPHLRGVLLAVLSQAHRHAHDGLQADVYARMALELGQEHGDLDLCVRASNTLGLSSLSGLQVQAAIASFQESQAYATETNDPILQSVPVLNLPLALNIQGDLSGAEGVAEDASAQVRTLQDWAGYSKALSHLASVSATRGDFRAAAQYAEETMLMVERSQYPWGGFRALQAATASYALRGMWDEAERALDAIIEPGRLFATAGPFVRLLVRVLRQLVRSYHTNRLDERIEMLTAEFLQVSGLTTYSLVPLCALIELGEYLHLPAITERPAEMLATAIERGVLFASGWGFLIPRLLGVAAMARDELAQAEEQFQHATVIATAAGARPELARTHHDYARLLLVQRGDAVDLITSASVLYHDMSMLPLVHAVQELRAYS